MTEKTTTREKVTVAPYVDIYESDDAVTLVAEMPGVDDKSAHIMLEHGVLTIEGDVTSTDSEKKCQIRSERRAKAFRRTFEVSESIDPTKITASMKSGVLTLNLQRREERKARRIEVSAA